MNIPDPITFTTRDGIKRRFSLTNSKAMRHYKRMRNNDDSDIEKCSQFLWECCDDKGDLDSMDALIDLMPLESELLMGLVDAIHQEWGARNKNTNAENERFRPTKAATPSSDGSGSQPSGASTSEPSTSSGN